MSRTHIMLDLFAHYLLTQNALKITLIYSSSNYQLDKVAEINSECQTVQNYFNEAYDNLPNYSKNYEVICRISHNSSYSEKIPRKKLQKTRSSREKNSQRRYSPTKRASSMRNQSMMDSHLKIRMNYVSPVHETNNSYLHSHSPAALSHQHLSPFNRNSSLHAHTQPLNQRLVYSANVSPRLSDYHQPRRQSLALATAHLLPENRHSSVSNHEIPSDMHQNYINKNNNNSHIINNQTRTTLLKVASNSVLYDGISRSDHDYQNHPKILNNSPVKINHLTPQLSPRKNISRNSMVVPTPQIYIPEDNSHCSRSNLSSSTLHNQTHKSKNSKDTANKSNNLTVGKYGTSLVGLRFWKSSLSQAKLSNF